MITSEILKQLRNDKKLTQQEVADAIGASKALISLFESGKRLPGRSALLKLADLYGVSADYIMQREEKPSKPVRMSPVFTIRENVSNDYRIYPTIPKFNDAESYKKDKPSSYATDKDLLVGNDSDDYIFVKLSDGGWALLSPVEKIETKAKYVILTDNEMTLISGDEISQNNKKTVIGKVKSITYLY